MPVLPLTTAATAEASPAVAALVVLVVLGLVVALVLAWLLPSDGQGARFAVIGLVGGLAVLGVVALLAPPVSDPDELLPRLLLVPLAAIGALGGGPVTATVLRLADRDDHRGPAGVEAAASVLRGGAWIGMLERLAIFATLVAGWPEGLAVVLAVKGLGRYPELRAAEDGVRTGVAERFIIGTFASVLWACGCAGVVVVLLS